MAKKKLQYDSQAIVAGQVKEEWVRPLCHGPLNPKFSIKAARVIAEMGAGPKPAALAWPPSYVPLKHSPAERAAKVALIKKLAEDLDNPMKGNYGMTLESLILHATALLADQALLTGRGHKGPAR